MVYKGEEYEYSYLITIEVLKRYQITIEDFWGLQSTSNIVEVADYDVVLWGEYYSVFNTTELDLSYNQLTGSIPSEIGNLTNLTNLYLNNNQLTGEIPESLCDLNIDWGGLYLQQPALPSIPILH